MLDELVIWKFLAMGAIFGLTAGISPGPLLTLVITETLTHNKKEGIRIAVSPFLTDVPIVLVSLFVFSKLSQFDTIVGVISLLGGIFVASLGYETIKTREIAIGNPHVQPKSLKKGIIANFLSPHPYLFWVTVGAPMAIKAFETNILALLLFFLVFYFCLIGSKIGIAFLVSKSKTLLTDTLYFWTMKILGLVMLLFSFLFIREGLKYLGVV